VLFEASNVTFAIFSATFASSCRTFAATCLGGRPALTAYQGGSAAEEGDIT
jgi:hypothetical protein